MFNIPNSQWITQHRHIACSLINFVALEGRSVSRAVPSLSVCRFDVDQKTPPIYKTLLIASTTLFTGICGTHGRKLETIWTERIGIIKVAKIKKYFVPRDLPSLALLRPWVRDCGSLMEGYIQLTPHGNPNMYMYDSAAVFSRYVYMEAGHVPSDIPYIETYNR